MVPTGAAAALLGGPIAQVGDSSGAEHTWLDLSAAQIYAPSGISAREERCLLVATQEVEKRTELRLPIIHAWPASGPVIVAGTNATLTRLHGHLGGTVPVARQADGYAIGVAQSGGAPVVTIAGTDERGVLFGVGKLLRSLRMTRLKVEVGEPSGSRILAQVSPSRPPARLSSKNQFLRRLDGSDVGPIYPRAGAFRLQHD